MGEGEIRLGDVLRILVRRRQWMLGTLAVVMACALALAFSLPPEWEAVGVIDVGQVGQVWPPQDRAIESVWTAMERMRMRPFQDAVLRDLGIGAATAPGRLYDHSLAVRILPNTDLIELKVRGYSADAARRFAQATVDRLCDIHRGLEQTAVASLQTQLATVSGELHRIVQARDPAARVALPGTPGGSASTTAAEAMLANVVSVGDGPEIRDLQRVKLILMQEMGPPHTRPTALFGEIYVPKSPVFPYKLLILVVALIAGLTLGSLAALIRDYAARS